MTQMQASRLLIVVGTLLIAWSVALFLGEDGAAGVWIALIGAFALVRGIGDSITGPTPDETIHRRVRFQFAGATLAGIVAVVGGVLLLLGVYGPDDAARYLVGGIMVLGGAPATAALFKEFRSSAEDPNKTEAKHRDLGPTV